MSPSILVFVERRLVAAFLVKITLFLHIAYLNTNLVEVKPLVKSKHYTEKDGLRSNNTGIVRIATLRRVCAITVAVEKQYYIF